MNVIFESEATFGCTFGEEGSLVCDYGKEIPIGDYSGSYTATPSAEQQTLPTAYRTLAQNIVIEPIPSNYGLITWNGSSLTVS